MNDTLQPKCLQPEDPNSAYQLRNNGDVLPCAQMGIPQGFNDPIMVELAKYSNISDYDTIEEIFEQPQWKEFYHNLTKNIAPKRCFFVCHSTNNFSQHSVFAYTLPDGTTYEIK